MEPLDCHVHAFAPGQIRDRARLASSDPTFQEMYGAARARMASPEEALAGLREDGFGGGLLAGFAFAAQEDCAEQNRELLAAGRDSTGSTRALATLNLARPGWDALADQGLGAGAAGFGELRPHSQGWDPLGPAACRLYSMAEEASAILLWHVSEPVGHRYPGKTGGITPAELSEVALRFPALRQIAGHLGAGTAFFLLMPELREPLRNLWFDTAATSLLYDDSAVERVLDLAGPGRVLFGSDYPLISPRRHLERVLGAVAPEHAGAIEGGNLRAMLGGPWK